MEIRERFASRLRSLRRQRNFSQEKLAEEIGRSVDAISNLERGKSLPSLETLVALSKALDVSISELCDDLETNVVEDPRRTELMFALQDSARRLPVNYLQMLVACAKIVARHVARRRVGGEPLLPSGGSEREEI